MRAASFTDPLHEIEVKVPRYTALHYLKTWFLLDLISSVPFALIFWDEDGGDDSSRGSAAQLNKLVRLLKLLKLLRCAAPNPASPHTRACLARLLSPTNINPTYTLTLAAR